MVVLLSSIRAKAGLRTTAGQASPSSRLDPPAEMAVSMPGGQGGSILFSSPGRAVANPFSVVEPDGLLLQHELEALERELEAGALGRALELDHDALLVLERR